MNELINPLNTCSLADWGHLVQCTQKIGSALAERQELGLGLELGLGAIQVTTVHSDTAAVGS